MDTDAAERLSCAGHRGPGALQALLKGAGSFASQLQQTSQPASAGAGAGQPLSAIRGPESVGRIAVEGLGGSSWRLGTEQPEASAAAVRAVLQIRRLVQSSRCTAVISVPAGEPLMHHSLPDAFAVLL